MYKIEKSNLHADKRSFIVDAKANSSESVTDLIIMRHSSNSEMAHDFTIDNPPDSGL